ncbi:MAG: endonuclease/exonuclease/phosphatase family protein [bacterium]|nr:endonuclease/exonuclease/phosphatase family protein [bacterium]
MLKRLSKYIKYLYCIGSCALLLIILTHHSVLILELISSMSLYIICAGIISGIILFIITRSKIIAAGMMLLFISFLLTFFNTIEPANFFAEEPGSSKQFSVLQLNVFLYNYKKDRAINCIVKNNPHIITLHEINQKWKKKLKKKLGRKYPYSVTVPARFSGVSLYSRFPIKEYKTVFIGRSIVLITKILIEKIPVTVITYHSCAPLSQDHLVYRNKQIKKFISIIKTFEEPKIVTGDFNTVPWSWTMRKLKSETALTDSRKSIHNTYPAGKFFKVPIDYILHSKDFTLVKSLTFSSRSSDHLGIISTYYLN